MAEQISPGQVVYLNSGSPPLTVFGVREDRVVDVEWFNGKMAQRDAFPAACLTSTKPNGDGNG